MPRAQQRARRSPTVAAAVIATIAIAAAASAPVVAQTSADPFEILRTAGGSPVTVPPRALAVIPERHTGRLIRVVDDLQRIEPQFDDLARGVGLTSLIAIQMRTREANIPIFVAKSDSTISTVLQLRLGTPVQVTGLLVERGNRYLMLASEVRSAGGAGAARTR
jgi:hypothetical protein